MCELVGKGEASGCHYSLPGDKQAVDAAVLLQAAFAGKAIGEDSGQNRVCAEDARLGRDVRVGGRGGTRQVQRVSGGPKEGCAVRMSRNSERMVAELVELGYNPAERLLGPDRHTGGGRLPGAVAARGRVQPLYGDSDRSSPTGRRRSRLRVPEILAGILPETDRVPTAGGELAQGPGPFPPAIPGERRGGATVTTARYRLNGAPDHRPSTTRWPQPLSAISGNASRVSLLQKLWSAAGKLGT